MPFSALNSASLLLPHHKDLRCCLGVDGKHWIQRPMLWEVLWVLCNSFPEFYIRSCFGICQEVLMPTGGQTARISFFSLTLPSHSSLFQNTHDYLTSLGPWPKPPPPSFLIFIQDFCRSFVYRNLKHYFLSRSYRFFAVFSMHHE